MASKKTLWVVLGCGGFLLVALAAFVGVVAIVVMRNVDIKEATAAAAEQEYAELRSHFQGQAPLIQFDSEERGSVKVNRHPERAPGKQVDRIQVYAWSRREGKVVHLTLPLWLLRLKSNSGSVRWEWDDNVRLEKLNVTVEDIERQGPGLLLDFEDRNGNRLLAWSE